MRIAIYRYCTDFFDVSGFFACKYNCTAFRILLNGQFWRCQTAEVAILLDFAEKAIFQYLFSCCWIVRINLSFTLVLCKWKDTSFFGFLSFYGIDIINPVIIFVTLIVYCIIADTVPPVNDRLGCISFHIQLLQQSGIYQQVRVEDQVCGNCGTSRAAGAGTTSTGTAGCHADSVY